MRRLNVLINQQQRRPWVRVFRQNLYFMSAVQPSVCVQLVNKSFQGGCYRFVFLVDSATLHYAPISASVFLAGERDALTTPHMHSGTHSRLLPQPTAVVFQFPFGQKAHVRPNRRAPVTYQANVGINQNVETTSLTKITHIPLFSCGMSRFCGADFHVLVYVSPVGK